MRLRERWKAVPGDIRVAYAATVGFVLWLALCVALGPQAFFLAPWCLVYPPIAVVALVLVFRLAFRTGRRQRILPLLLVSGCLVTFCAGPWITVCIDLHLICRVYRSGGPTALNDWAQGLIRECGEQPRGASLDVDGRIPPGIRTHLSDRVWVERTRTMRGELSWVGIALGGGHYHYGVAVYPQHAAPAPEWWQQVLGWPPEVAIYHE